MASPGEDRPELAPHQARANDAAVKDADGHFWVTGRLLKEIMGTGEVGSDVTALEDATSVEKLKALVKAGR